VKFVSIDLETTGLDPQVHQIVEFAAVLDDLVACHPVEQLSRFHAYVRPRDGIYRVSEYCLHLHADIWAKLAGKVPLAAGEEILFDDELPGYFADWLTWVGWPHKDGDTKKPLDAVTAAGKNFASFDEDFIVRLPGWDKLGLRFHHRKMDPGVFFARYDDKVPPDTNECLKRAGITDVTDHRAMADAINVVRLLRTGMASQGKSGKIRL
jgi:oligoribonuclease